MNKRTVHCGNCGEQLDESAPDRAACPHCESSSPVRRINVTETIGIKLHERVKLNQRRKGVRKPIKETIVGSELRRATGEYVEKRRVIDREKDRYEEYVESASGEVLRDVFEPLSQHHNRGSAKFNKKS